MSKEYFRRLIETRAEGKNIDYKLTLNWNKSTKDEKVEIVKDILAMANTQDGGKLVFGVRDKDFESVGLSKEDYESFDQTKTNDFLHKYTDPKHSCQVKKQKIGEKFFIIIDIPEFQREPIICKKEAHSSNDKNNQILKKGQIYIRTEKGTSEAVPSAQEMRELLGRAITKKGDELLHNIECLLKGKPSKATDESEEKYKKEIKEANEFLFQELGDEINKYGFWEIYAYPTEYNPRRITNIQSVRKLLEKSKVNLQGWDFPHTESNLNASNFSGGRQSVFILDSVREGYRAYKSGLFVWKSVFWEDAEGHQSYGGRKILDYVSTIYSVTE